MKLAISLVAMFVVLGGALGATDKCLTSCTKIKVSGFSNDVYDGVYTPEENTAVGEKPTRYVKEGLGLPGELYVISYNEKENKYVMYRKESEEAASQNLYKATLVSNEYVCLEDLGKVKFAQLFGFNQTPFLLTTECLSTPTTTTSPCKPCRQVTDADKTLNGYYELMASGDSRCTMDGCLYKKYQTEDMYCFNEGVYTVTDLCPS